MSEASTELRRIVRRAFGPSPKAVTQNDPALFSTVRAAISFAYSIEHFPIASHPKFGPSEGATGRLSCLSAHEKHAQGALIRGMIERRLSGMDVAVTLAFHGSGKVRSAAILHVGREVAKLIHKPGLGNELAKRQFSRNGIRKSQQELADEFGLSQRTVSRLDKTVVDEIDRLRLLAEQQLEALFVQSGIAEHV